MSSLSEAVKLVSDLIDDISTRFQVNPVDVVTEIAEHPHYMFFKVTLTPYAVAELSIQMQTNADFQLFCDKNNLNGLIWFNSNGTLTFSMCAK